MWKCPGCGKYNSDEYCDNCGKHYEAVLEPKRNPAMNKWTINDLAIIALTIAGAIILLTTSLVKIPYLKEYLTLNNLAFGNWNDYFSLSTVFQYFEKAGWMLLLMKVAAVALYTTIIVSLVEAAKKLTIVSRILRWVSVGIGLILVITMTWVKARINQDLIASIIAGNLKYGYGGILLGLIFFGTAVFLSFRKDLLNITAYEFGALDPYLTKESTVKHTETEHDNIRSKSPFETPMSNSARRELDSSDEEYTRSGSLINNTRIRSFKKDSEYVPDFVDPDKANKPGKLKSTLRARSIKPFDSDEVASFFKRPDDL